MRLEATQVTVRHRQNPQISRYNTRATEGHTVIVRVHYEQYLLRTAHAIVAELRKVTHPPLRKSTRGSQIERRHLAQVIRASTVLATPPEAPCLSPRFQGVIQCWFRTAVFLVVGGRGVLAMYL